MALPNEGEGYLIGINKSRGMTSHDVVAQAKRILHAKKVGHAGTLDPFASGVLILGIGEATKLLGMVQQDSKRYRARIQFGLSTTTDDCMGDPLDVASVPDDLANEAYAKRCLAHFVGAQEQIPPAYSAIHIEGKRAYQRAAAGDTVLLPPRVITVHEAKLQKIESAGNKLFWDVEFLVSKGTYIRSLARDIGEFAGTKAHLFSLGRSASGNVQLSDCISVDELRFCDQVSRHIIDPLEALHLVPYRIDDDDYKCMVYGSSVPYDSPRLGSFLPEEPKRRTNGDNVGMVHKGALFGIYELRGHELVCKKNLLKGVRASLQRSQKRAVTIGTFDGVHTGHTAYIRQAARIAHDANMTLEVHLFTPDPASVIKSKPQSSSSVVLPVSRRAPLIRAAGADKVIIHPFTQELAQRSYEEFLGELHPDMIIMGANNAFGEGACGTVERVRRYANEKGILFAEITLTHNDGVPVSSSRIRELLCLGDIASATKLLGYYPFIEGIVVRGRGQGKTFGFPTANVVYDEAYAHLLEGVYAGYVLWDDRAWPAAINVGRPRSFSAGGAEPHKHFLEATLLGFEGDLYGAMLTVVFVEHIRQSTHFESIDELKRALTQDVAAVKRVVGGRPYPIDAKELQGNLRPLMQALRAKLKENQKQQDKKIENAG